MKSFSRRLGYLHNSSEAVRIAEQWLSEDGLLGDVAALNDLGRAMLANVAPVAMEATLGALERGVNGPTEVISDRWDFVRLVRSIAYDPNLFDRSAALLVTFSVAEEGDDRRNGTVEVFTSLFHLYLSGTCASIEQRLRTIETLLQSDDPQRQGLGVKALSAVLEAWRFMSSYGFEFGAHSRDHGYWPRSYAEVNHWFSSALKLVEAAVCSDAPVASEVRVALAQKFRGLWAKAWMYDDLERICRAISARQYWREGWIAVRETLRYDSDKSMPEARTRLASLEQLLRPRDLVQTARSIVLSSNAGGLDFSDYVKDETGDLIPAVERTEGVAEALGKETAQNVGALGELLPELVHGGQRLWPFGRGLAAGAEDPEALWKMVVAQLAVTQEDKRNVQVLRGFLNALGERNPELSNRLLDDALEEVALATFILVLYPGRTSGSSFWR